MIPALILTGWGAILGFAYALFRAAGRADRVLEQWDAERERAQSALDAMGDEADSVGWDSHVENFGGGWRLR